MSREQLATDFTDGTEGGRANYKGKIQNAKLGKAAGTAIQQKQSERHYDRDDEKCRFARQQRPAGEQNLVSKIVDVSRVSEQAARV